MHYEIQQLIPVAEPWVLLKYQATTDLDRDPNPDVVDVIGFALSSQRIFPVVANEAALQIDDDWTTVAVLPLRVYDRDRYRANAVAKKLYLSRLRERAKPK